MSKLSSLIEDKKGFLPKMPATEEEINKCEKLLELSFSDEYKDYLINYGEVSFYGHELTGITDISRLNVVEVTLEERALNPKVPDQWYVIEQTNLDGIVIWQSEKGEIYKSYPEGNNKLIFKSLTDYIEAS